MSQKEIQRQVARSLAALDRRFAKGGMTEQMYKVMRATVLAYLQEVA